MLAKFNTPNHVVSEAKDTVACCAKFVIPDEFTHRLEQLYPLAQMEATKMLARREESSTKFYKSIPSVIAKSLIAKYQRNPLCRAVRRLVLPICGDEGRQVKYHYGCLFVPALFGKLGIPFEFPKTVVGFVRQIEFFKREGQWFGAVCYNTPAKGTFTPTGVLGVDRNSVGNIAVCADLPTGAVRKLGPNPARLKQCQRGRRRNLQKRRKFKLLAKLKRKQSRRTTFENHRASKTIVAFALKHRRAVVLEKLTGIATRFTKKSQWSFAQLESFLKYKCALSGVPLLFVNPAFTSQDCSCCGNRNKPNGKHYECETCGHNQHRDVNAAFNIALRGQQLESLSMSSGGVNISPLRPIGSPPLRVCTC